MAYDPHIHHRRSVRLPEYDYSLPGRYFVTIVTHERREWFGTICEGAMQLNRFGCIVEREWRYVIAHLHLEPDAFIIMPNHVHGIVAIPESTGPHPPLGTIISQFKSRATKHIWAEQSKTDPEQPRPPVWQRSYYERVIRDESELDQTRFYIRQNPANWGEDKEI